MCFLCIVSGAVAVMFLSCWSASCAVQEFSFIKHKVGGAFVGPCILASGRSVGVIRVEGVFVAVAQEGFL